MRRLSTSPRIIGSFIAGTVLSGFLIQDSTLQLGRRYGVALLLESLLLCVAVPLLKRNHHLRHLCRVVRLRPPERDGEHL